MVQGIGKQGLNASFTYYGLDQNQRPMLLGTTRGAAIAYIQQCFPAASEATSLGLRDDQISEAAVRQLWPGLSELARAPLPGACCCRLAAGMHMLGQVCRHAHRQWLHRVSSSNACMERAISLCGLRGAC